MPYSPQDTMNGPVKFTMICAWCTKVMSKGTVGAPISHGICKSCTKKQEAKFKAFKAATK